MLTCATSIDSYPARRRASGKLMKKMDDQEKAVSRTKATAWSKEENVRA